MALELNVFPNDFFRPYAHQKKIYKAFFQNGITHFLLKLPRRTGKTHNLLNFAGLACQYRVGTLWYAMPTRQQASTVIWNGIDFNGFPYLAVIPESIREKPNNKDLRIPFKNGSQLQFVGAYGYDRLRSGNPMGLILDEAAYCDPGAFRAWEPALKQNNGFVIFVSTPDESSQNWFYKLWQRNEHNPEWFVQGETVETTFNHQGTRIITEKMLNEIRAEGATEDYIRREYYCEFATGGHGGYFEAALLRVTDEKRRLNFPIKKELPVYTFWDLGVDVSAIWWIQKLPDGQFSAIMSREYHEKPLSEIITDIYRVAGELGIVYGQHFLPHDGDKRETASLISYYQQARDLGLYPVTVIDRTPSKLSSIEMMRMFLSRVIFHEKNTERGWECLCNYGLEENNKPMKWPSHLTDAFMQCVQNEKKVGNQYGAPPPRRVDIRVS